MGHRPATRERETVIAKGSGRKEPQLGGWEVFQVSAYWASGPEHQSENQRMLRRVRKAPPEEHTPKATRTQPGGHTHPFGHSEEKCVCRKGNQWERAPQAGPWAGKGTWIWKDHHTAETWGPDLAPHRIKTDRLQISQQRDWKSEGKRDTERPQVGSERVF